MRVIVSRRLALQERSATVLVRDAEIWTYGARSNRLLRYEGLRGAALTPATPLPSISAADAALAWDGQQLLAADRSKRSVFRVDPPAVVKPW